MPEARFFETLPLRPFPFEGECLSGYVLRLAELNGYSFLWDLVSDLFPTWKAPQQIGRLKWEYPPENWGRMPLRSGLSSLELNRLTVTSWVEKFRSPLDTRSKYSSPGNALRGILKSEPASLFSVFAVSALSALALAFVAGDSLSRTCLSSSREMFGVWHSANAGEPGSSPFEVSSL